MPAGVGVLGLERPGKHLHALQEELLDPLGLLVHLALQVLLVVAVLQHQGALLQGPRDPGLQLAHGDRFEQEVGGAQWRQSTAVVVSLMPVSMMTEVSG